MHTTTLTGGMFEQRPVTMQEIADAHDTCTFVLADHLRMRLDFRHHVRLTAMRPHPYVPCTDGRGWGVALWRDPDWYIQPYLGFHDTNRFAFEISADFRYFDPRGRGGNSITPHKPPPPRQMTDEEAAARLHKMKSAAECSGADVATVRIDFERRAVTGEYLYLPDHPVVAWVRAFGTMPYVNAEGKHAPARGVVYTHPAKGS